MRGLSLVVASGGHSSLRCAGLSPLRPLPLWSTGSRHAGSVVVAHGLSCSAACGILPDQGSNPFSPALAGRLSTTVPPGKPLGLAFLFIMTIYHLIVVLQSFVFNVIINKVVLIFTILLFVLYLFNLSFFGFCLPYF